MARHTASFHGGTPILIQTWFSHLNAYASTCAQYPNEYPNLAFPISLSVVFFSLLSTRFSRCCSTWESANPAAVVVLAAASVATSVLAVASDCRAAASAAAVAARHACSVGVSFFFLSYITLTLPPRT